MEIDKERYKRNILLPEVGEEGQKKLAESRVLVVGAGGLGSPVSLYLAAAGVGTIGIADFDRVDVSNLQRQILYREQDIGKAKAELAAEQLQSRNHSVQVELYPEGITAENAEEILAKFDVIVDASDNFPTRYLLSDTCMKLGKPDVYGAICEFRIGRTMSALSLSGGRGPIRKPEFGCLWCAWRDSRHDRVYAGGRSIEASFGQGRAADWKNAVH